MEQRRFRPGDVLDDYCPRERRITDHAIVAMIEDDIKQTRCVVCDAEHEYKEAKVPPQRRKKSQGLFNEVLDGLQGPRPAARLATPLDADPSPAPDTSADVPLVDDSPVEPQVVARASAVIVEPPSAADTDPVPAAGAEPRREEGFFRRTLIRASLPRPEGQPPPARAIPEFTIRQPATNSRHRGGRRRGGGQPQGVQGPMRFGRDAHAPRAARGSFGQPNGNGNHQGRRRRGGKKR